jgi:serine/threonine-protein kinase
MSALRLQDGSLFAGRYRVLKLIGQGSMGSVYHVEEEATGRWRALKIMSPELLHERAFVTRFEQEAEVGRTIRSEHVVSVVASGIEPARQLPWLAMELLEGRDLARVLEEQPELPRGVAVEVLRQLFDAMGAAHEARVVHRDLRPENVFVCQRGEGPFVKVLDFGVAKVVRESTLGGGTAPGLGAPLWAAPEQGTRSSIQPNADVWALGLLAFRLLAGRMFWKSANQATASALDVAVELLRAPIPPASERARELGVEARLPPGFDAWFARAVHREHLPHGPRYPAARPAWEALAPLLGAG